MLIDLKKAINEHREGNFPSEAILESTSSVKDAFLDDPEVALLGAENDPEIAALINDIPGYDDGVDDAEMKKNVEALTESTYEAFMEAQLSPNAKLVNPPGSHENLKNEIRDHLKAKNQELKDEYTNNGKSDKYYRLKDHIERLESKVDLSDGPSVDHAKYRR
jgi:hypothetical protein